MIYACVRKTPFVNLKVRLLKQFACMNQYTSYLLMHLYSYTCIHEVNQMTYYTEKYARHAQLHCYYMMLKTTVLYRSYFVHIMYVAQCISNFSIVSYSVFMHYTHCMYAHTILYIIIKNFKVYLVHLHCHIQFACMDPSLYSMFARTHPLLELKQSCIMGIWFQIRLNTNYYTHYVCSIAHINLFIHC